MKAPWKEEKRTKQQEHRTKVQRQKAPAAREITLWTSRDSRTTTRPPRTGIHTARQATAKRHSFLLYTVPFQTLRPISFGPPAFWNSRPSWRMFAPVSQRTRKQFCHPASTRKQRAGCVSHISEFDMTLQDRQCFVQRTRVNARSSCSITASTLKQWRHLSLFC